MTAAIRIPTHSLPSHDSFAAGLSVSARAGLTGGLSLAPDPALAAELAYRRERLQARRVRRGRPDAGDDGDGNPRARRTGPVTRWISWLPSAPRRRSSAATVN